MVAAVAAMVLAPAAAHAQASFYTDVNAYQAAVTGNTTTIITVPSSTQGTTYNYNTLSISDPGGIQTTGNPTGDYPGGPNYITLFDAPSANTLATVSLTGGSYRGGGFYFGNVGGFTSGTITVNGTSSSFSMADNGTGSYGPTFVGFTSSSPITSFTLAMDGFPDYGIDMVGSYQLATGLASTAPEPATWAMMIGGFGFIGGMLRRRRREDIAALA
ncbi:PEPxxWA-CTERM sorting domain-containing protein [Sphingomonas sp. CA1-15]|uniref:PEPxxWA-CTERM sorting domain-containing protein n=1 Tax=Sphingomonas immobilis TaxID=3063997 RepID=A0ABT8ZU79_9SPHN|nr:PEPxxWA-CTERM sorting domain-containing protein [Sphingomonas sp. CA1-15]